MAIPDRLQQALQQQLSDLQRLRGMIARYVADMAVSNISIVDFSGILTRLAGMRADIVDLKGRAGVAQFVRNSFGRDSMDIVVRYNAVQTSIETAALSIRNGMPMGAQGFVLAFQLSASPTDIDQIVWRTFTPAQTTTVRADLSAVVTAIDALFDDLAGLI